jgi:hypothetical protein
MNIIDVNKMAEPYGWTATHHSCIWFGEFAREDAEDAARSCGIGATAFPVYKQPPELNKVLDILQKRYMGDNNREDLEVLRCIADVKKYFGVTE